MKLIIFSGNYVKVTLQKYAWFNKIFRKFFHILPTQTNFTLFTFWHFLPGLLTFLAISYSGSVPPHQQNLHPLHQRHITIPTSVPQQQVFTLAEPPKRKPYHLLHSIARNTFFRKWGLGFPSAFVRVSVSREHWQKTVLKTQRTLYFCVSMYF